MTDQRLHRDEPADPLVESARSDREAFGKLFDHYYPSIFAYCLRRLIVRAAAEDVTSEVFLKVAGHIRSFSGSTVEDFRRWLYRIACNEINAHLRQSIRRRDLLESAVLMGRVNADISVRITGQNEFDSRHGLDWSEVYQAIEKLSEKEQSIVSLRFFGGMSHEEIGKVLETRPGTVRVAMSRALAKLRELLLEPAHPQREAPARVNRGSDQSDRGN